MSAGLIPFSLVRFQPDMSRQEVINVGIVLFLEDGPRVSIAPSQGKLLALSPNFRIARLFALGSNLQAMAGSLWEESRSAEHVAACLDGLGAISLSRPGVVQAEGRAEADVLEELQRDLVNPPPKRRERQAQTSRLHSELRQLFRQSGILGTTPNDINRHLVVPNFPIDPEVGLFAEFALRNGQLHVTETVDFRTSAPSVKRQEAQAKTLLLVQAQSSVGRADLKRYVVVTGASAQVQASMNLLERHSEDLIVRESSEDWRRYVDAMHAASHPGEAAGN